MKKIDKEKNFISAIVYVNDSEKIIENFLNNLIDILENNFLQYEIICVKSLEIDAKSSLAYFISIIDGNITRLQVADGTYRIDATGTDIKIDQLRNSNATEEENIYKVIKSTDTNIEMCTTSE